jgi:hypothetical protein
LYKGGFSISNQKFTSRPTGGWSTKTVGWVTDALCINSLCYAEITATQATDEDYTYIYACDDAAFTSSLLYTSAIWATTVKSTLGSTPTPKDPFISAPRGQRLCVFTASTTGAISALTIYAIGTTRHVTGGDVPDSNYTGSV